MPYRVATVSTPLWADHQRSRKKGTVANGEEFYCDQSVTDGGLDMLKTSEVEYISKETDLLGVGDGWIEAKNCVKFDVVDPEVEPAPVPGKVKRYLLTLEELP